MFDHIADHLAHPPGDHGSRQAQKNNTGGILQHPSQDVKALEHIPALEGSVLKGLNEFQEVPRLSKIQVAHGVLQISGFPLFIIHRLKASSIIELLRKLTNKH
jgi:hypothetical protein